MGETNDPASIVVKPVLANFSINSSFVVSEIGFGSFCSPSRGPTSTSFTGGALDDEVRGGWSEAVAKDRAAVARRAHGRLAASN